MGSQTLRKYKPRARARPDRTAEAQTEAQVWLGRLQRAVEGTTAGLRNHETPAYPTVPDGPLTALLRRYLGQAHVSRDALTIRNHAMGAIRWMR